MGDKYALKENLETLTVYVHELKNTYQLDTIVEKIEKVDSSLTLKIDKIESSLDDRFKIVSDKQELI